MQVEIDLNDHYEIIKKSLKFPQVMKDKLIDKLNDKIEELKDSLKDCFYNQGVKELELMRLRLKEIESIEMNDL